MTTISDDMAGEFDAILRADGSITVPEEILRAFGDQGVRVHVRLTSAALAARLRERNVTEEEVDRIAAMQHESRSQVLMFLNAEQAARSAGRPGKKRGRR